MAFDRDNTADLLALKTEVNSDPLNMVYDVNDTAGVLELLNNPSKNQVQQTGVARLTAELLLNAVFDENLSTGDQFKVQLLFESSSSLTDDLSQFRDKVKTLSTQLATAIDLIVRPLSRAEVLFSGLDANGSNELVIISRDDWIAARES